MSDLVDKRIEADDEVEEVPDSEKTPVTIITGFLGIALLLGKIIL
jgi:hypothetical protein